MAKTFFIASDMLGEGDEALGRILMKNFLYSLARNDVAPKKLMFANRGVFLACQGSESLDDLRMLAQDGVAIASCGTCLDFYGLTEKLAVGVVGTMPAAVETLAGDAEVVTVR